MSPDAFTLHSLLSGVAQPSRLHILSGGRLDGYMITSLLLSSFL